MNKRIEKKILDRLSDVYDSDNDDYKLYDENGEEIPEDYHPEKLPDHFSVEGRRFPCRECGRNACGFFYTQESKFTGHPDYRIIRRCTAYPYCKKHSRYESDHPLSQESMEFIDKVIGEIVAETYASVTKSR